jgi:hypothetical protein
MVIDMMGKKEMDFGMGVGNMFIMMEATILEIGSKVKWRGKGSWSIRMEI